ncbi:MAG TPA: hypothetical protein VFS89_06330 [Nitrosospira sp.]|nr:hypothetical protein [Nitrosospira sp.]
MGVQGNVTQELQAAASGSGINALSRGVTAGDVDLVVSFVAPQRDSECGSACNRQ